jgi:hypothetical protein
VLDAVLGFIGAERANESREDIARDANAFSAQQYANRYQTTVKDMQAAGLNPMLAYSQGAGSAPTGQQAQGIENSVATATEAHNRATQRSLASAQVSLVGAQTSNVQADTAVKQKQAALIDAQTRDVASAERLKDTSANEATVRMASQLNYGNPTQKALAASYWSQISVNQANLPKIASEIVANGAYASQARAAAFKAIQEGRITQADYQRALNAKNFEESAAGRAKPFTEYGLNSAQRAADIIKFVQPVQPRVVIHKKGK